MILQGENIILRSPQLQDATYLMSWENNEEVMKYSTEPEVYSLEQIREYIKGIHDVYLDKQLRFMICRGEEPIGTIDLYNVDQTNSSALIGILIADVNERGNGLGSEAHTLVRDYCRDILGLQRLEVDVQVENKRSIRFFEANGYKHKQQSNGLLRMEWTQSVSA